jgi:polysulfide reductase-like protein
MRPDGFEARLEQLKHLGAAGEIEPRAPATGYYGLPLLKTPVWTWEIPAYLFIGGAAGAAAVIGAAARVSGASTELVRDARWIAAVGGLASPPLLISDLGRPERFLNMLRVFKLRSAMSVGAWTLVAFTTTSTASAFADLVYRRTNGRVPVRVVADAAEMLSAATGLVLSTYTGVLIGATAVPVWSKNAHLLPLQFGVSGVGAAVSMLELAGHRERALNRIAVGAALVDAALSVAVELDPDPVLAPLKRSWSGQITRAGGLLSGPIPLALRVLSGRSPAARRIAAACTVAGSLLTRIGWIAAGRDSVAESTPQLLRAPTARRLPR